MIVLFYVDTEHGNGGNQNNQIDKNDDHDVTGQEQDEGHNKSDQNLACVE